VALSCRGHVSSVQFSSVLHPWSAMYSHWMRHSESRLCRGDVEAMPSVSVRTSEATSNAALLHRWLCSGSHLSGGEQGILNTAKQCKQKPHLPAHEHGSEPSSYQPPSLGLPHNASHPISTLSCKCSCKSDTIGLGVSTHTQTTNMHVPVHVRTQQGNTWPQRRATEPSSGSNVIGRTKESCKPANLHS
jgi:hypothetical protein